VRGNDHSPWSYQQNMSYDVDHNDMLINFILFWHSHTTRKHRGPKARLKSVCSPLIQRGKGHSNIKFGHEVRKVWSRIISIKNRT
jgi:hypothetical protein